MFVISWRVIANLILIGKVLDDGDGDGGDNDAASLEFHANRSTFLIEDYIWEKNYHKK